jgi:hypothetical protein
MYYHYIYVDHIIHDKLPPLPTRHSLFLAAGRKIPVVSPAQREAKPVVITPKCKQLQQQDPKKQTPPAPPPHRPTQVSWS